MIINLTSLDTVRASKPEIPANQCYLGQSMGYFNRLTREARCLADYSEWLQFCWDFVKPPRNDEITLQQFFFLLAAMQAH